MSSPSTVGTPPRPATTEPGPAGPGAPEAPPGSPPWEVRGWRDGDDARLRRIDDLAFGHTATDDGWLADLSVVETDRMTFVADPAGGDAIVGSAGVFSFELSVPGGRFLPAAGVSWVSVSPTHRRQGVLRALMAAQLADIAARAEPLAVLWCSEATIYGRFGYGHASSDARFTVDRHRAAIDPVLLAAAPPLRAEIVEPLESLAAVESVYEAVRATRPGMPRRSDAWQRVAVADGESDREGASRMRAVLFRDSGGEVRAAARYRVGSWLGETAAQPRRTQVLECYADSPQAGAVAWNWIGGLDLVGGYRAGTRPVDDPLPLQLADLRAAVTEPGDGLWARLVDLPAAVAARGYAGTADVTVEVTDTLLPANAGRWRVRTEAGAGTASRTGREPDVVLDIRVLGGAYLGAAGALVRAHRAGRVDERTPGAVLALSRAFESELQPWCPVHF